MTTAHIHYKKCFDGAALRKLYDDKISLSRAVGRDGTSQSSFKARLDAEVALILKKVDDRTYPFTNYREKLISKGANKPPRILSIPTIRDRLTLRALNDILSSVFADARLFRPHVYIKRIKTILQGPLVNQSFVRIDVKEFYPSIDHAILLKKVRRKIRKRQLLHLIQSSISTPTGNNAVSARGVPQGLSVSNILSAVFLEGLDRKFEAKYAYFRYVDDILVICDTASAPVTFSKIERELRHLRLACHELGVQGKSTICSAAEGIDYLGYRLTPLTISVRHSSYQRMIENLLAVFTQHKHTSEKKRNDDRLVWLLNIKITGCIYNGERYGWVFFFSQIDDVRQLARLDNFVTRELKRRGLDHLRPRAKRFTRSFHEITLNLRKTRYIPKFDNLPIEEMIRELSRAQGKPEAWYGGNLTEQQIRREFSILIRRQTRQLERDLIEATS